MTDVYVYHFMRSGPAGENILSKRRATLETIKGKGEAVMESQIVVDHTEVGGASRTDCRVRRNVLATYVRTKALTQEQAINLRGEAERFIPVLTRVTHEEALEAAIQFGISAYDARFIALAKQLRTKLVTEDIRLRAAVPSWAISLAEALG